MRKIWVLSKSGYKKIAEFQDKYKFMNTFAIDNDDSAEEFLKNLREANYLGLSVSQDDCDWIDSVLDKLGTFCDKDDPLIIAEVE